MHQRVRSADERHFNYVCFNCNEAQETEKEIWETRQQRKQYYAFWHERQPLSCLRVLCCPSEELEEIAYDCSLECSEEGESGCRVKRSRRHQSDPNYWGFLHTAPKLHFNSARRTLTWCLYLTCSTAVDMLSIYFIYCDTAGWLCVTVGDLL